MIHFAGLRSDQAHSFVDLLI